jgi:hypothetical protein
MLLRLAALHDELCMACSRLQLVVLCDALMLLCYC